MSIRGDLISLLQRNRYMTSPASADLASVLPSAPVAPISNCNAAKGQTGSQFLDTAVATFDIRYTRCTLWPASMDVLQERLRQLGYVRAQGHCSTCNVSGVP